ncbi:MAG TPA: ABC transporter ATP-binding protein [Phycisphaerae bacterium]|nr:ABC transporter ATP-binding protein [Phycisphaerae bacterium]
MLLEVENLNKKFGGSVPVHVLKDINLSMDNGQFAALVGPSGAGKTTMLNIISTLDSPTSGHVRISGVEVHSLGQAELNRFRNMALGFIFQDDLLLGHLTALENVMAPGRIARRPYRKLRRKATELLDKVGLSDRANHKPGQLSGGQRQRVNLARALMNDPELLLADEPTARLDSETGSGIIQLLVDLNDQFGVTILMVTHEHHIAQRATRIIEFLDGRIAADRPIRDRQQSRVGFQPEP